MPWAQMVVAGGKEVNRRRPSGDGLPSLRHYPRADGRRRPRTPAAGRVWRATVSSAAGHRQSGNRALGVEREIASSSSFMSLPTSAKSGVLR